MNHKSTKIFLSSSSDMAKSRKEISDKLDQWLGQIGHAADMQTYKWDEATKNGDMLSDREPIQPQLLDTMDYGVPFTICLFGERCGVPLEDNIPEAWHERLEPWRAPTGKPGLVHPWPKKDAAHQTALLSQGGFPLTGTMFELISACANQDNRHNLIVGYCASHSIGEAQSPKDLVFNHQKEYNRLRKEGRTDAEKDHNIAEKYAPQVQALFNLLRYFIEDKGGNPFKCKSENELQQKAVERAKDKLKIYYGIKQQYNPFKKSLAHWTVEDTELPGRQHLVNNEILPFITKPRSTEKRSLVLITGRSGCGKSSVLQCGVLGALQRKGMEVLAFRPTDLDSPNNIDRLDILWEKLGELIDIRTPTFSKRRRHEQMSDYLITSLNERNIELALGIDQFEEMLDEMAQFNSDTHKSQGWWSMLRFLKLIAESPRVVLVATLESSREKTFKKLDIDSEIGLGHAEFSADVLVQDVATIARNGFKQGGLELADALVQVILDRWAELAKSNTTVSPLPLVCLWLADLYERFEGNAERPVTQLSAPSAKREMNNKAAGESPILTLEDVGGKDAVNFAGLIAQLADECYQEATGAKVPDKNISEHPQEFDNLIKFLDPLVALDGENHIRLLNTKYPSLSATTNRIIELFSNKRLVVLDNNKQRARLMHQSVINQWPLGQSWKEWRQGYLEIERDLREQAKIWVALGRQKLEGQFNNLDYSIQVLYANREEWVDESKLSSLSADDHLLREFCLRQLSQANSALEVFSVGVKKTSVIYMAAMFSQVDLVKSLIESQPVAFEYEGEDRVSLLHTAAWVDSDLVEYLISYAKKNNKVAWIKKPGQKNGWHPIAGAILGHANKNFKLLAEQYDDVNEGINNGNSTMLIVAAQSDNLDAAKYLLSRSDIDIVAEQKNSFNAIDIAAYFGSNQIYALLLEKGAFLLREGKYNPLHRAAKEGRKSIIEITLDSASLDESVIDQALLDKPNKNYGTPLMVAAQERQPAVLALLLKEKECDPSLPVHRRPDGSNLLHLVFLGSQEKTDKQPPSRDSQTRAKECVNILVKDGRLNLLEIANGKTAYELSKEFKDARRVLRQHMPLKYEEMEDSLKREDLLSANARDWQRLITEAPQVLKDKIDDLQGIDLLIREKQTPVLAFILEHKLALFLIRTRWNQLIPLASEPNEARLRKALVKAIGPKSKVDLSALLDVALRDGDERESEVVSTLVRRGIKRLAGSGCLKKTVFHHWAESGDIQRFEHFAALMSNLALPLDDWGRPPSELASIMNQKTFKKLESEYFQGKAPQRKNLAGWPPFSPLEKPERTKLDPGLRSKIIKALREIEGVPDFETKKIRTLMVKLPFYKTGSLIEVTNPDWNEGLIRYCFLHECGNLTRLAGTSPPIHQFNAKIKISLQLESVREYLAHFCFFVRGDEGPFYIVDRLDSSFIPASVRTKVFDESFRPVKLWGQGNDGYWRVSALVYYSNALFWADFLIHPTGMIEMLDDTPVIGELTASVNAPLGH